ncbi:endonuclease-reverse transcriptase [Plakobranchus ocellatus]|uniref:Endonuclease-reverse transcriptase n=1 Tax=Plakobranchus ocellatus TaxID=259542 RepID=A0AAV4E3P8_9GAST|nr:endonuclease-reverse transcriptase [Plakobranchus ocellatus]
MIFRKADLEHGLNVDGETLANLRFADDVALITENVENVEEQLNVLNNISLESGLKMHKGKTRYMNNFESNKDITIDKEKIEKVESYKYLGQTTYLKDTTKEEVIEKSNEYNLPLCVGFIDYEKAFDSVKNLPSLMHYKKSTSMKRMSPSLKTSTEMLPQEFILTIWSHQNHFLYIEV